VTTSNHSDDDFIANIVHRGPTIEEAKNRFEDALSDLTVWVETGDADEAAMRSYDSLVAAYDARLAELQPLEDFAKRLAALPDISATSLSFRPDANSVSVELDLFDIASRDLVREVLNAYGVHHGILKLKLEQHHAE
jgi:hypothetical protein